MPFLAASAYLAEVKWNDEDCHLHDFINKNELPQVIKITKGQFANLGMPSFANPSLNQFVLIARSKRIKVAAQCVKFENKNIVAVGSKLAIPDSYEGWFEILSEDLKPVPCIETVYELWRKAPATCLVREIIEAHLAKVDDADILSDKTRTIYSGETLIVVDEVKLMHTRSKSGEYLKCFTAKGEAVFLGFEQKGKFSTVATEKNVSGVHTIDNLLAKCLPLMVRLVHGKPPFSVKSNSNFVPEMRLCYRFEEDDIMAIPFLKKGNVVTLPPTAPLKVQAPKNLETLPKLKKYYDEHIKKYTSLMQEIRVDKIPLLNVSDDTNTIYDEIDQIYDYTRGLAPLPPNIAHNLKGNGSSKTDLLLNSSSPSSSLRGINSTASSEISEMLNPKPIETIPLRRQLKDEKPALPVQFHNNKLHQDDELDDINSVEEYIYDKVSVRKELKISIPRARFRKRTEEQPVISHQLNCGVKKLLMVNPAQNKNQQRPSCLKNIKNPNQCVRSRSPTASREFNRGCYKSLGNLGSEFDAFNLNYYGGQETSGSSSSNERSYERGRLRRHKTLADLSANVDNGAQLCKYWNKEPFFNGVDNRKSHFCHEVVGRKLSKQHKRVGTLYL